MPEGVHADPEQPPGVPESFAQVPSGPMSEVFTAPPRHDDLAPMPQFEAGDEVLYWSDTHRQWVEAKVIKKCEGGVCYDLDAKKGALAWKMRLRPIGESAAVMGVAQVPRVQPPRSQGPQSSAGSDTKSSTAENLAIVCADPDLDSLLGGEAGYLAAARPGDVVEVVFTGTRGDEIGWIYGTLRYSNTAGAYTGFGWLPAWALRPLDIATLSRDREMQAENTIVPVPASERLGVLCDSVTKERPRSRVYAYMLSRPWERGWVTVPDSPEDPPRSAPEASVPASPEGFPSAAPERVALRGAPEGPELREERSDGETSRLAPLVPRPPGLCEAQAAARAALPAAPGVPGLPPGFPAAAAGGGASHEVPAAVRSEVCPPGARGPAASSERSGPSGSAGCRDLGAPESGRGSAVCPGRRAQDPWAGPGGDPWAKAAGAAASSRALWAPPVRSGDTEATRGAPEGPKPRDERSAGEIPRFAPPVPRPPGLSDAQAAARATLPASPGGRAQDAWAAPGGDPWAQAAGAAASSRAPWAPSVRSRGTGAKWGARPRGTGGVGHRRVMPSAGYEAQLARRSYAPDEKKRRAEARQHARGCPETVAEEPRGPGGDPPTGEPASACQRGPESGPAPGGTPEPPAPLADSGVARALPVGTPPMEAPRRPAFRSLPPKRWATVMYHMRELGRASWLRSGPCDQEPFVQFGDGRWVQVVHNQRVQILRRTPDDEWAEVQGARSCMGWIRSGYLRDAPFGRLDGYPEDD